MFINDNSFIEI